MSKLKSLSELFAGHHFERDLIILCVRWYLRYKLSLRDLVDMMAERGLSLAHSAIFLDHFGYLHQSRLSPTSYEFVEGGVRGFLDVCNQVVLYTQQPPLGASSPRHRQQTNTCDSTRAAQ
jgi:hypothetical protein